MAISFDSLPFPFPENQREVLLRWREAAIAKERELCLQRQARTQRLRDYVQQRLKMIEAKKQQSVLQESDPINTANLNQKAGGEGEVSLLSQKTGGGGGEVSLIGQKAGGGGETAVSDTTAAVDLSHLQAADRRWHTGSILPPSETHRGEILSGRHHGTSVSESGSHKTVSPRRRLFVADRGEEPEKKRAGNSTKDPYVLLTALARGYLTRRLLKSEKVQSLVNTIKDAGSVLASLDTPSSQQDLALRERVLTQLQVAQLTLHEIMFDLPVREQLAYIAHSRVVRQEKKLRLTKSLSGRGTRQGQSRLSSATVKAIGRRQKGTTAVGASKPPSTGHERTAGKEKATKPTSSSSTLREGRPKVTGSSSLMSTRVVSRATATGRAAGGTLGARKTKTPKPSAVKSKWK